MCKWYCTSEGPSTSLRCRSCGCNYCGACLHGDAGKMKSLAECARCKKKPTVAPSGQNNTWQCVAAAPSNIDFSSAGVDAASGAHPRVAAVSSSTQDYSSMCRTPDAPAPGHSACSRSLNRRASTPSSIVHPDQVNRVKLECHVCGYKSFPQWLNDQAHCLKCDAVLKRRPSCQQRRGESAARAVRTGAACSNGAARRSNVDSAKPLDASSRCQTPEAPARSDHQRASSVGMSASASDANVHPDQTDRVKMECHVCLYKSFPQWLNDQAHCLKCDAVLKTRPSCQQRQDESARPASGTKRSLRTRHQVRDLFHQFDSNGDGLISLAELKEVLQGLPVPERQHDFTDAGVEVIFKDMDENQDGFVDHNEFSKWFMREGFRSGSCVARMILQVCSQGEGGLVNGVDDLLHDEITLVGAHTRGAPNTLPTDEVQQYSNLSEMTGPSLQSAGEAFSKTVDHAKPSSVSGRITSSDERPDGVPERTRSSSVPRTKSRALDFVELNRTGRHTYERNSSAGQQFPNLLSSGSRKPVKAQIVGPERFFYDKSSYTGTHACGGPDHVAKGSGTSVNQSWKRP